jgi:hypothetical protein
VEAHLAEIGEAVLQVRRIGGHRRRARASASFAASSGFMP